MRTALSERSGKSIDLRLAEGGEGEYRSQFFYRNREQFGAGRDYYDNLTECVTILLQVQANHERSRNLKADTR